MKRSKVSNKKSTNELELCNENIQLIVDDTESFVDYFNIDRRGKKWLTLSIEEALLKYQDASDEKRLISYSYKKRFGSLLCEVYISGSKLDVLHPLDNGIMSESNAIDHIFNTGPGEMLYRYKEGTNIISITIQTELPKIKLPGPVMLQAIVFGIVAGLLIKMLPADVVTVMVERYISPIYSTLMAALKGITEPVIFITLIVGICALDDLNTLNNVGRKIILSFLLISTVMFVMACAVCIFVFKGNGQSVTSFDPSSLLELLLTAIPTNIIAPFSEGNMIQIVILGVISGIVLLSLGEKVDMIKRTIIEFKFFFFSILQTFVKTLPIVVFLSVVKVILTVNVSDSAIIWKLIVVDQGLNIILAIGLLLYISIKYKVKLSVLFKKISPLTSLAFVTGSSTAVIPDFYKTLPNRLGIDEKYVNYWVPLSNSFFSPSTIFALIVYAFFATQAQGSAISIGWIIILYVMIIQIGMATPRIPGGIIASVSILFSQLGLNTDQLGIIMGANVLILYLDTAVATITRCVCAIDSAAKEGYCNLDILRDSSK